MNMKKNILLVSFLLATFGKMTYANNYVFSSTSYKDNKTQQIKFGPQLGLATASGRLGLFGEYKLNESLGLQTGLAYFSNGYLLISTELSDSRSAITILNCISAPVILRMYPGNDRQFCWFGGIQLGYVVKGKFLFLPKDDSEESIAKLVEDLIDKKGENFNTSLGEIDKQDKVQKFQFGITAGFDYEFRFGLILGLSYTKELINIIKSEDSLGNWASQFTLGYNFGKFLKN
jgi:hypothetical protein